MTINYHQRTLELGAAVGNAGLNACSRSACIPFDGGSLQLPCPVRPVDIYVIIGWEETSHINWSWQEGLLTMSVDPALDLEQLTGFLILR